MFHKNERAERIVERFAACGRLEGKREASVVKWLKAMMGFTFVLVPMFTLHFH